MQFYEPFDSGEKSINATNLTMHPLGQAIWGLVWKHTVRQPNKCRQCDFISNQAGDLRRHLKTRSGENSNKSNQCDHMSSCAYNLRTHLKTHSGEVKQMKPMWICIQADTNNLRTHLKTHSGEKLHKCNRCDLASSWANSGFGLESCFCCRSIGYVKSILLLCTHLGLADLSVWHWHWHCTVLLSQCEMRN